MRLSDGREGVRRSAFRPRRIDSKHPNDALRRGELEPTDWWAVDSRVAEERRRQWRLLRDCRCDHVSTGHTPFVETLKDHKGCRHQQNRKPC